ncbi:cell wall-binding repeat-containing protein [Euzebya sp.]|uniref:cell wall-binding repeat-containing protein n=1 Tax=Euzebya sp. TaxID=1971409 RepID=UPI0035187E5A
MRTRWIISVVMALALSPLGVPAAGAQVPGSVRVDLSLAEDDVSPAAQVGLLASRATFDAADTVVLATGADGADALASGVLQGESPLHYVDPVEGLTPRHTAELERLGAREVVIVGGTSAVGEATEAQLRGAGFAVERLAGTARIETAAAVAAYAGVDTSVTLSRAFGTAQDPQAAFADAAGLGAWAAASGVPTVLTSTDADPAATRTFYAANPQVTRTTVVGGPAAVSDDVLDTLADEHGQAVDRVSSPSADTRAGTAIAVSLARGLDPADLAGVVLVDGYADGAFLDAYALAGLAARNGYAVLLTDGDRLTPETAAFLDQPAFAQAGDLDVWCMPTVSAPACGDGVVAVGGDPADLQEVTIADDPPVEEPVGPVVTGVAVTDAPTTVTAGPAFAVGVAVEGESLEGVEVVLSSPAPTRTATAGEDGRVTFAGLVIAEAGTHILAVAAGGLSDTATVTVTAASTGGGTSTPSGPSVAFVTVPTHAYATAGADQGTVVVRASRDGSPVTSGTATLTVNATSTPAPIGPDGRASFTLDGLAAGTHDLVVEYGGAVRRTTLEVRPDPSLALSATAVADGVVLIGTVTAAGAGGPTTVQGRLQVTAGGTPVQGLSVAVCADAGCTTRSETVITDATGTVSLTAPFPGGAVVDGQFHLHLGVAAGTYTLRVTATDVGLEPDVALLDVSTTHTQGSWCSTTWSAVRWAC